MFNMLLIHGEADRLTAYMVAPHPFSPQRRFTSAHFVFPLCERRRLQTVSQSC